MKTATLSIAAAALMLSAVACHKNPARPTQGPMQRAGEKVDDAAEKVKDGTRSAAKKGSEDAKDAKDTIKKKAD